MTTPHTTDIDDEKLEQLATELESDRELHEATLDGLNARMDTTVAGLEESDIDAKMAAADADIAEMAETVLKADVADMEALDQEFALADAEEDQLLEDDELPVEETAAKLTPEDTGLAE